MSNSAECIHRLLLYTAALCCAILIVKKKKNTRNENNEIKNRYRDGTETYFKIPIAVFEDRNFTPYITRIAERKRKQYNKVSERKATNKC